MPGIRTLNIITYGGIMNIRYFLYNIMLITNVLVFR